MLDELRVSVTEAAVAVVTILSATAAMFTGNLSSDAYVGLIGYVLGYVFGRVRNGRESQTESPEMEAPTTTNRQRTTTPTAVISENEGTIPESEHVVPGTKNEGE